MCLGCCKVPGTRLTPSIPGQGRRRVARKRHSRSPAKCFPPPNVLLQEPILHQHHVKGGCEHPPGFPAGGWQCHVAEHLGRRETARARGCLPGGAGAPIGAQGWQSAGGQGGTTPCCSSTRVLAGLKHAQRWVPGCRVSSACSHLPSFVPLCSSPLSLCQRQRKAQQQREPASQELTALKTKNGEKQMCVSPPAVLSQCDIKKAVGQTPGWPACAGAREDGDDGCRLHMALVQAGQT